MHPTISDALSRTRVAELHARADARRLVPRSNSDRRLSFRYAEPSDRPVLERLAALDGAELVASPVLVAEIGHAIVAAIGTGGEVIADPFVPTSRLVRTLRALHADPAGKGRRGLGEWVRTALAW